MEHTQAVAHREPWNKGKPVAVAQECRLSGADSTGQRRVGANPPEAHAADENIVDFTCTCPRALARGDGHPRGKSALGESRKTQTLIQANALLDKRRVVRRARRVEGRNAGARGPLTVSRHIGLSVDHPA